MARRERGRPLNIGSWKRKDDPEEAARQAVEAKATVGEISLARRLPRSPCRAGIGPGGG